MTAPPKICVCVKAIPGQSPPWQLTPDGCLDRTAAAEINGPDAHAIEAALDVSDRNGPAQVVLVSMGPDTAVDAMRQGLAMGADRAVLVSDPVLAGSDLLATSRMLAAVLAAEAPDLIIFGWESADGNGALLGSAVGQRLGIPVVSRARDISMRQSHATLISEGEQGVSDIDCELPCVVTLSGPVNQPRYPSMKGILKARRQAIERVNAADLGLGSETIGLRGSGTAVLRIARADQRHGQVIAAIDAERGARAILEFLNLHGIVG